MPIRFARPLLAPGRTRHALGLLLIVATGGGVFATCLGFDFVYYDDYQLLIGQNAYFTDPRNLITTFFHDAFAHLGPESAGVFYRPLLIDSFIVDTLIGGGRSAVYHMTNLALHLIAAGLVFVLLIRLDCALRLALFLALVFCLHPALASVTAWLPGRNDSLLAIFAILHALFLFEFLKRGGGILLFSVLSTLALALFTKETAVAFAALIPAFVWVEGRRDRIPASRLWALAVGSIFVFLVWVVARKIALGETQSILAGRTANIPMLIVYLGKTLFPYPLFSYPSREHASLVPGLVVGALLAIGLFRVRSELWGRAGLGLFWYAAFLGPTLLSSSKTSGLEHRLCVPLIGLLLCAAELLPSRIRRLPPLAAWGAVLAILAALAAMTLQKLPDYSDGIHFWESASRTSPRDGLVWENLARRYLARNRWAEFESAANTVIELNPDGATGYVMLGVAWARQGRFEPAEAKLRHALEIDPEGTDALGNLAQLLRYRGRIAEAAKVERRLQALREDSIRAESRR